MTTTTVELDKVEDVPAERLNENDDPRLVDVGRLVTSLAKEHGATDVTLALKPSATLGGPISRAITDPLRVEVHFHSPDSDDDWADAGQRAENYRSQLPKRLARNIEVEGPTVWFDVTADVAREHGRVGTYTNHKCRGPLCQLVWRDQNRRMKQDREELLRRDYDAVEHGRAATYTNWGCRCDLCTTAWARDALVRKQVNRLKRFLQLAEAGKLTLRSARSGGVRVMAVLNPDDLAEARERVAGAGVESLTVTGQRIEFVVPDYLAVKAKLQPQRAVAVAAV